MSGGEFLLKGTEPSDIFTPEDLTPEHRAIVATTDKFWRNDIAPRLAEIQRQEPGVLVSVLKKSAELGLLGVMVPEKFGGMEMDLVSMMLVAEGVGRDGSYAASHGAHAGIGTLPLLLFGTEEQKAKYLPKLASGEWIGAYCLTEPQAGSDALAAKTRADLTEDGSHYVLNGQKMWITNGGIADLYTVFAKVGGEHFTAFLVERSWAGVRPGAEEHKMGIKGSSTTAVFLDGARVPKENVLGEIGRGHIIAFNILNVGRLKLGSGVLGGMRSTLGEAIRYARERKAFGKPISDFGLIQQKLGEMAIRTYATEAVTYRVIGMIGEMLSGLSWEQPDAAKSMLKAFEEFAAECSVVKVFASEALNFVVDEAVQIHGGYGYHHDYAVETAYRDSRINRIFEGTNEINRLLITGMLLKRAQRGKLGLVEAVRGLQSEVLAPSSGTDLRDEDLQLVTNSKKIVLLLLAAAYQKFLDKIEEQQEVIAGIADAVTESFAMESVLLRARKSGTEAALLAADVFVRDSMMRTETVARNVLAACAEGDGLRTQFAILRRYTKFTAVNSFESRRQIARRLVEAGRYIV
ncbi:MAG: acyl-CoA dehydrogenase family protein [Bryobacteraceae bacterium]|nr:acyl-CoA dehydrogenase family protein [Bryobacteraceae bacterium]